MSFIGVDLRSNAFAIRRLEANGAKTFETFSLRRSGHLHAFRQCFKDRCGEGKAIIAIARSFRRSSMTRLDWDPKTSRSLKSNKIPTGQSSRRRHVRRFWALLNHYALRRVV